MCSSNTLRCRTLLCPNLNPSLYIPCSKIGFFRQGKVEASKLCRRARSLSLTSTFGNIWPRDNPTLTHRRSKETQSYSYNHTCWFHGQWATSWNYICTAHSLHIFVELILSSLQIVNYSTHAETETLWNQQQRLYCGSLCWNSTLCC